MDNVSSFLGYTKGLKHWVGIGNIFHVQFFEYCKNRLKYSFFYFNLHKAVQVIMT